MAYGVHGFLYLASELVGWVTKVLRLGHIVWSAYWLGFAELVMIRSIRTMAYFYITFSAFTAPPPFLMRWTSHLGDYNKLDIYSFICTP